MSSESPERTYVDPLLIETYKVSVLLTTVSMATNEIIIIIIILFIERHIQRAVRGAVQHSKAGVKRNN